MLANQMPVSKSRFQFDEKEMAKSFDEEVIVETIIAVSPINSSAVCLMDSNPPQTIFAI